MSLYQILGVEPDCSEAELKKAYRRSVMKYHPDKQANPSEEATQKFLKIVDAYTVLSNPIQQEQYDKEQVINNAVEQAKAQMSKERKQKIEELNLREKAAKVGDPLQPYRNDLSEALSSFHSNDGTHSFEEYERIIITSLLGYYPEDIQ